MRFKLDILFLILIFLTLVFLVFDFSKNESFEHDLYLGYSGEVDNSFMLNPHFELNNLSENVQEGVNIYCNHQYGSLNDSSGVMLVDNFGNLLKELPLPYEADCYEAKLFEDSLVVLAAPYLLFFGNSLNDYFILKSEKKRDFHHDFWIFDDQIYVLSKEDEDLIINDETYYSRNHFVEIYTLEGDFIEEINLFDVFKDFIEEKGLRNLISEIYFEKKVFDLFHVNTIQVLEGDNALWSEGDLLLSIRNLNLIVILDSKSKEIKWSWGPGEIFEQHHPSILSNGNLLIFDNGRWRNGTDEKSRIVELNPSTKEVVWEYQHKDFYSKARGGVYELENGNLLITESNKAHVFEITKEKEIVWEWFNPSLNKKGNPYTLYRMNRVSRDALSRYLDKGGLIY